MLSFGDTILLWRSYRSLSQAQLAAMAGIPRPNLSDIEKGKRDVTLTTIVSLANALGVSPGTLVDGKAPGYENRIMTFTRESMERIAHGVAKGRPPKDPTERQVYSSLRDVLHCGLARAGGTKKLPFPSKKGNRAWLMLRALYPAETVNSLIERSLEHAERP
jgi:transcriptional regulator with XRE-family HTH domain